CTYGRLLLTGCAEPSTGARAIGRESGGRALARRMLFPEGMRSYVRLAFTLVYAACRPGSAPAPAAKPPTAASLETRSAALCDPAGGTVKGWVEVGDGSTPQTNDVPGVVGWRGFWPPWNGGNWGQN